MFVWGRHLTNRVKDKLPSLERMLIVLIMREYKTISKDPFAVLTYITSMKLTINYGYTKAKSFTQFTNKHKTHTFHKQTYKKSQQLVLQNKHHICKFNRSVHYFLSSRVPIVYTLGSHTESDMALEFCFMLNDMVVYE